MAKNPPSPGIYAVTSLPLLSLTRATFLSAELGFFGLTNPTRKQTPFMPGRFLISGETLLRAGCGFRQPRITWFKVALREEEMENWQIDVARDGRSLRICLLETALDTVENSELRFIIRRGVAMALRGWWNGANLQRLPRSCTLSRTSSVKLPSQCPSLRFLVTSLTRAQVGDFRSGLGLSSSSALKFTTTTRRQHHILTSSCTPTLRSSFFRLPFYSVPFKMCDGADLFLCILSVFFPPIGGIFATLSPLNLVTDAL
jgi:hypothetical protein